MKVKLLKKIRKRFQITHMPNGFFFDGRRYEYNLFKLTDSTNEYYGSFSQCGRKEGTPQFTELHKIFETEKECINYLKSLIIRKLREEGYKGRKDNQLNMPHKKVWWV